MNPERARGRGTFPGLPRSLGEGGCLAKARVFDLVIFPTPNSSRASDLPSEADEG